MDPFVEAAEKVRSGLGNLVDKDPTLTPRIIQAVKEATATESAADAKAKLDADRGAADSLRAKLNQIVPANRPDPGAADKPTQANGGDDKQAQENTDRARAALIELVKAKDPIAYTPSIVSYLIIIGFFAVIALLIFGYLKPAAKDDAGQATVIQIVNICIGALSAAFATVVNFWLGSSLGSRRKDDALAKANAVEQVKALPPDKPR